MHTVKRIEIIANSFELGKILDALKKAGVPGHIVIRNVAEQGLRGTEDLDMTMLDNVYIIAFCPPEKIETAIEIMRAAQQVWGRLLRFGCIGNSLGEMRCLNVRQLFISPFAHLKKQEVKALNSNATLLQVSNLICCD